MRSRSTVPTEPPAIDVGPGAGASSGMMWAEQQGDGVALRIRVQPRARKSEVVGLHGGALKIRLQAPPVDGKANQALLRFLADRLGVAASAVRLVSGEKSRDKTLLVSGVDAEAVAGAFPEAG